MKNFFSIEYLKQVWVILFLEMLMIMIGVSLINLNNLPVSFFNMNALIVAGSILLISSLLDRVKYFNFWTLFVFGNFIYICWWVIFELTKL